MVRPVLAVTMVLAALGSAQAQESPKETYKIGLVAPLTGPFTSTGKQVMAGAQFYLQQNGNTVAGKRIELVIKDDAGIADQTRRLVQEFIVNDKVNAIAGFGLTPLALAAAPLATQSKTPMIVMAAATSIVTERSPYIVRTSFAQAQPVVVIADWQARHGMKKVVSMVSDFAPGYDSETFFKDIRVQAGATFTVDGQLSVAGIAPGPYRVVATPPDAFAGADRWSPVTTAQSQTVALGPGQAEDWSFADFASSVAIGPDSVGNQLAVIGNLTSASVARQYPSVPVSSFLTAYPAGADRPLSSNLNTTEGPAAVPNMAVLKYGANNTVRGPGSKSMNLSVFRSVPSITPCRTLTPTRKSGSIFLARSR